MTDWLNPPVLGALQLGEAERRAVTAVLDRGELFRHFDGCSENAALETELGSALGCSASVVSSGTAGLRAALVAVGVRPGDRVLVSAWTFVATAAAVHAAGARPVPVDVGPDLGVDLEDLTRKLPGAAAFVGVYLPGHTSNFQLLELGIPVVEDACQALGVRAGARPAGTVGHLGVVSFQQGKQLTSGEGGAVLGRDPALVAAVARYADHGAVRHTPGALPSWEPEEACFGDNLRLGELQAAVVRVQLSRLAPMVARQRQLRAELTSRLLASGAPLLVSARPEDDSGSCALLLAPTPEAAQAWRREAAERRVHLRPVWPTCWMDLGSARRAGLQTPTGDCPRARYWAPRTLALPVPPLDHEAGAALLAALDEVRPWR